MHTLRRHESPFERLSEALKDFLKRRLSEVVGLVVLALVVASTVALVTWSAKDPSLNHATSMPVRNALGSPGAVVADLLIQLLGLGAAVFLIAPAAWALMLLRRGRITIPALRFAGWVIASGAAAGFVGSLPTTAKWPLPTGIGGVVGDAVLAGLRAVLGLGGTFGLMIASVALGALCLAATVLACGVSRTAPVAQPAAGRKPPQRPSRPQDESDDSVRDDEPSWAIISMGAVAHAAMSAKSALRRRLAQGASAYAESRQPPVPTTPRKQTSVPMPLQMGPRPAASDTGLPRIEPTFGGSAAARTISTRTPVAPAADLDDAVEPFLRASRPDQGVRQPIVLQRPLRGPAAGIRIASDDVPVAGPQTRFDGDSILDAPSDDDSDHHDPAEDEAHSEAEDDAPWIEEPEATPVTARHKAAQPSARARVEAGPAPVKPASPKPAPRRADPRHASEYELPPLPLLAEPKKQVATVSKDALEQNATLLESTLEDFGVRGEIINVRPGPVVTLYELEPAPGTKSSRVIGLADDIARSMSAVSARVAVVPGRNAIGIELPNQKRETVFLRELLASQDFTGTSQKLALCLGKNIGGEPIIADLARMPHLLVAGTTGSGKSVAINTMILSLLYMHKPEHCRLIMVDPKMLELSVYDGIPHLLSPVVTDPKKAVIALKWAVREMEERYKKMSKLGVRNIDGFNARVAEAKERHEVITRTVQTGFDRETGEAVYEDEIMDLVALPYIVVIVDEMADLMMVAGKDIEGAIQRLAQMARAAGIHLIMATQRPSVDVITGTIKANFPTRISFQVTSKIDSRTILGEMGAEQLLGQGDMLYMMGGGRITRVHGPFVSDTEVEKVVAHLKAQGRPQYLDAVTSDEDEIPGAAAGGEDGPIFDKGAFGDESQDPYDQAIAVVMRDKKASTSYIQRRLGIGYNRAASIMERMEKEGIVGAANHAGKREILLEHAGAGGGDDDD